MKRNAEDIEYGLGVARAVAGFDIGQTVVVAAQACVAVEAMEGTDAAIERAGLLMRSLERRRAPARGIHPSPSDKDPSPGTPTFTGIQPWSKSPSPSRTCASTSR